MRPECHGDFWAGGSIHRPAISGRSPRNAAGLPVGDLSMAVPREATLSSDFTVAPTHLPAARHMSNGLLPRRHRQEHAAPDALPASGLRAASSRCRRCHSGRSTSLRPATAMTTHTRRASDYSSSASESGQLVDAAAAAPRGRYFELNAASAVMRRTCTASPLGKLAVHLAL
jgi:hypothetical protein